MASWHGNISRNSSPSACPRHDRPPRCRARAWSRLPARRADPSSRRRSSASPGSSSAFWVGMPWVLRDQITWLTAQRKRLSSPPGPESPTEQPSSSAPPLSGSSHRINPPPSFVSSSETDLHEDGDHGQWTGPAPRPRRAFRVGWLNTRTVSRRRPPTRCGRVARRLPGFECTNRLRHRE